MKVFSTAPDGNEAAEFEPARYFNLAKREIQKNIDWLKDANKPYQAVLVHVDILVYLSKKYPDTADSSIKEDKVIEWKSVFYAWYERCKSKIPKKFREGIKENADELFAELGNYGH